MVKKEKKEDSRLYAFIATFLSIIGVLIVLITNKKHDKYVNFYTKQSLVIFIISIIAGIAGEIFNFLPIIGGIIKFGLNVIIMLAWVLSWVYALSGEMKEIPIISNYSKKFSL